GQASSRGPRGNTGRSGASQSAGDKLHALAVDNYGYLAQALCDVLGRQQEAFDLEKFVIACNEKGPGSNVELMIDVVNFGAMASMVTSQHFVDLNQPLDNAARAASRTSARVTASRHSAAAVRVALLVSDILTLLARCLTGFQAAVV
ncbi:hypothetical protein HaLaN_31382, partial [Haematococcus lacustris]